MYDPVANPEAAKKRRDLVLLRMLEQGYLTPRGVRPRRSRRRCPAKTDIRPPSVRSASPRAAYFVSWVRAADRRPLRRAARVRGRAAHPHDARRQAAAGRRAGGQRVAQHARRPAGLARRDRQRQRRGASDGRRRRLRVAPVQPRDAGPAPARLGVQAVRSGDRARSAGISAGSVWASKKLVSPCRGRAARRSSSSTTTRTPTSGPRACRRRRRFSDNAVYVQVGMEAGLRRVARTAEELGIRTPVSSNPAMPLGGLKAGVTALDMAHAYSSLAEGGVRSAARWEPRRTGPSGSGGSRCATTRATSSTRTSGSASASCPRPWPPRRRRSCSR